MDFRCSRNKQDPFLKTTKMALKTKMEPVELNTMVEPVELKNTVQLVELETTVGLVEQWLSGYDRGHREFSYGLLLSPKGRQSSEMASVAIIGQAEVSETAFLVMTGQTKGSEMAFMGATR